MPDLDLVPPSAAPPGGAPGGTPAPPMSLPPIAPAGATGGPPPPAPPVPPQAGPPAAGPPAEYAAIFDQPKRSWQRTLLLGLLVLVALVGIAGVVNRFVFDLGLGQFIPFFARPTSTGETPSVETVQTPGVGEEASGVGNEAKERDLQRKADLALIQSALTVYQEQKGAFPTTVGRVKLNELGNSFETALVPTFLVNIPTDPQSPQFTYQYQSDGQTYSLTSIIEDSSDPQAINAGTFYYYEIKPTQ